MLDADGKKVSIKAGTEQRLIDEHGYSHVNSESEATDIVGEAEPDNSIKE